MAKKFLDNSRTPQLDAEILLSYVLCQSITWIKIFDDFILNDQQLLILQFLLYRRYNKEPIAYIIQKKEFWSIPFIVTRDTLIPRPETEILVEISLKYINNYDSVLDLGTGCGNIAISISLEKPLCNVYAVDLNYKAINIAIKNSILLHMNNVKIFFSNWFSHINQKFNVIISNPPYLNKLNFFQKEILFEPPTALFSDNNGIKDITYIINHANNYLYYKGWLLIEHCCTQSNIIYDLFKKNNFINISIYKDYSGYNRVTLGQKN